MKVYTGMEHGESLLV